MSLSLNRTAARRTNGLSVFTSYCFPLYIQKLAKELPELGSGYRTARCWTVHTIALLTLAQAQRCGSSRSCKTIATLPEFDALWLEDSTAVYWKFASRCAHARAHSPRAQSAASRRVSTTATHPALYTAARWLISGDAKFSNHGTMVLALQLAATLDASRCASPEFCRRL
jgi:hypothetical protein